jgi:uncharacterized protein (TIGR00255 family)
MIVSMTGYGKASCEQHDFSCHAEVRSVNNRFLKTLIRLPDDLSDCEADIEKLLREQLSRGSVTVNVTVTTAAAAAAAPVNLKAAQYYLQQLTALAQSSAQKKKDKIPCSIDLAQILLLPGVCSPVSLIDEKTRIKTRDAVLKLVRDALKGLMQMRQREGQSLWQDLKEHLDQMSEAVVNIRGQAPLVARQYHERLRARVMQLVSDAKLSLNDADLLREVALFSERADISEELSRLSAHLDHFIEVAQKKTQVGRTLEFLAQEMLRETNTIGSKASDGQIGKWTLQLKGSIDRIKEQVQNVE